MRFVALGGFGEIGMNCLVVEAAGRLLIIDCGVMFPARDALGIDVIHPAFEYLVSRREDIEALLLTHGHEDHIAGVPYLLREVDLPIYGTRYAIELVETRMREFDHFGRLSCKRLDPAGRLELGPFSIQCFPMPHSIIDNVGLRIDTPAGSLLHTGDFRLGLGSPEAGKPVLERLAHFARGGVDVMISDSTGSEETEPAGEERSVTAALDELVGAARGAVFVAIFASNVRRLEAILGIAQQHGRRVLLCGRSVQTHARVASAIGALDLPPDLLLPIEEVDGLPRERLLVVISGTQGEQRSALGRLAADGHRQLNVERGDLVILSSRFIPGNEIAISQMIDRLLRLGARVIHHGNHDSIHVSGHGSSTEIRMAIEAVRPRAFLPAHGTYRHMTAAAELARASGVPSVVVASDGQPVRYADGQLRLEEASVPVGRIAIDGGAGLSEQVLRDRRLLGMHGLLSVSWYADDDGRITRDVQVVTRGVTTEEAQAWLADQVEQEVRRVVATADVELRRDGLRCRELVRAALRRFVAKTIKREPFVVVTITPAG